ncbi:hypothetical protein EGW08_008320 [Elysia chlorotica]|uniref:Fibrinogen C-terminal domain-containing protein n=1 Tax=Elysia chlorotica TaxID=188477 RepID=A0A3S1BHP0_ELYCH|nr:hypothetical protein EGW08_008320 [Elysia chlorotica]
MALRDLFTTARLVTLLVTASAATGLVQKQGLNAPTAHDSSSTSLILTKSERLDAKRESVENGFVNRSATDSNAIQEHVLKKKAVEEILTPKKMLSLLKQFFLPESCQKNVPIFHFSPMTLQYPVILNSEFPRVDKPLLCDMATDGGGWIVIQRRTKGDVDFYRDWGSYKAGFGTLDTDFWLGNDNIHFITRTGNYELRVDLKYFGDLKYYAHYDRFSIADEHDNYRLSVGTYSGTAGDSLKSHDTWPFSTHDVDNDYLVDRNCAEENHGAWWYHRCKKVNLNGEWGKSMIWFTLTRSASTTSSEMKIRRSDNNS